MSLTALLEGKKVWAENMLDRTLNYVDETNQKMILVKGSIKIDHFRHYPNQFSLYETERDTEEHDQGKKYIYTLFKQKNPLTDVEVIKPEISRRGDVVIPEQNLVIEFQCSSISKEEMEERENDWRKIDYRMLWVFGTENYFHVEDEYYLQPCETETKKDIPYSNSICRLKAPEQYYLEKYKCLWYFDGSDIYRCIFNCATTNFPFGED